MKKDTQIEMIKNLAELATNEMNNDVQLSYISAIRSITDAILFGEYEESNNDCKHPDNERLNLNTMGSEYKEYWECKLCGYIHKEKRLGVK